MGVATSKCATSRAVGPPPHLLHPPVLPGGTHSFVTDAGEHERRAHFPGAGLEHDFARVERLHGVRLQVCLARSRKGVPRLHCDQQRVAGGHGSPAASAEQGMCSTWQLVLANSASTWA